MASLLRQIVAGPRARHPEAGLDLCYVTDNIVATSGPSQTYPQRAYRNPLDRLVNFLDSQHGKNWAIWEFRAEGTGYPDELVYSRIRHYPWPDHHPPPFRLVPMILASMRNWLNGNDLDADAPEGVEREKKLAAKVVDAIKDKKNERVVVVHCKAGKGRSGTMACSYLIAECGWTPEAAIARFTERRMRPNFGPGVSIPSQLRWLTYVDRWTKGGKKYVDREVEIVEVHVWGLRDGVKLAVEGFAEEGKKIKVFHTFTKKERQIVEGNAPGGSSMVDMMYEMAGYNSGPNVEQQGIKGTDNPDGAANEATTTSAVSSASKQTSGKNKPKLISRMSRSASTRSKNKRTTTDSSSVHSDNSEPEPGGMAVIFKPKLRIRIPNNDVNITIERRHRAPKSVGLTMVTAVAHVWFNTFFEGNGPEQDGVPDDTGVFEIEWDKLDGIKGSSQKGTRAADRIAVVWKSIVPEGGRESPIQQPSINAPVPQMQAADWKGDNDEDPGEKRLGLRVQSPDSAGVSKASSLIDDAHSGDEGKDVESDDDFKGLNSDVPTKEDEQEKEATPSKIAGDIESKEAGHTKSSEESLQAYTEKLPNPEGSGT
ncbi:phosphatases II [Xylaria bambusicola]|uniref:phosphatases II n=1 Tax=Xylaria bambusicola TaxID=326684 RepID=UPI0020087982|nr:phosphatases II [Xylaria bambusicola]KAI0508475.1 phosphatases II [Xylaria bambusicola]